MKVYVVYGNGWSRVVGVCANEETAKKLRHYKQWCAGCEGSSEYFSIKEYEVKEEFKGEIKYADNYSYYSLGAEYIDD